MPLSYLAHRDCRSMGEAEDWYRPKERRIAASYSELVTIIGIFLLSPAPWSLKSVYTLLRFASGLHSVSKEVFDFWLTWKSVAQLHAQALRQHPLSPPVGPGKGEGAAGEQY